MKNHVKIEVRLKPGHSDPEGETTAHLLRELGYKVDSVEVGKVYRVVLEAATHRNAEVKAEEICKRLLANPTKDNYFVAFEEER
jgi:phosphoribosylformylglycinamidine synthase